MKKIETGAARPETFPEQWPGQCEVFSHLEYACGIPSILYAVTTYKENGLGNVCCGAWASFPGDGGGFYALVPLPASTHTLTNIRRTGEFCVNFLPVRHFDALMRTVRQNGMEDDEFTEGGFTPEPARTVGAPRIAESFLTLECRAERIEALSDSGRMMLVKGRVLNAVSAPDHAQGVDKRYGPEGFVLNINEPRNLLAHHSDAPSALATLHVGRNINNRQNHKRPAEHSAGRLCCYKIIPAWQCSARKPRPAGPCIPA